MSDNRVPIQAKVFENLDLATPPEDQPSPVIDGRRASLVVNLGDWEASGGVLVRRTDDVNVVGDSSSKARLVTANVDLNIGSAQNTIVQPGTFDTTIFSNSGILEINMIHVWVEHVSGGSEEYTIEGIVQDFIGNRTRFFFESDEYQTQGITDVGFAEDLIPGQRLFVKDEDLFQIEVEVTAAAANADDLRVEVRTNFTRYLVP